MVFLPTLGLFSLAFFRTSKDAIDNQVQSVLSITASYNAHVRTPELKRRRSEEAVSVARACGFWMYARECHSLVPFAATKTNPRNAETGQPKCRSGTAESRLGHFTGASECRLARSFCNFFRSLSAHTHIPKLSALYLSSALYLQPYPTPNNETGHDQ
jgi:hypothetical protein